MDFTLGGLVVLAILFLLWLLSWLRGKPIYENGIVATSQVGEPVISFINNYKKYNFRVTHPTMNSCYVFDKINKINYCFTFDTIELFAIYEVEHTSSGNGVSQWDKIEWITLKEKELIFNNLILPSINKHTKRKAKKLDIKQINSRKHFSKIYCK